MQQASKPRVPTLAPYVDPHAPQKSVREYTTRRMLTNLKEMQPRRVVLSGHTLFFSRVSRHTLCDTYTTPPARLAHTTRILLPPRPHRHADAVDRSRRGDQDPDGSVSCGSMEFCKHQSLPWYAVCLGLDARVVNPQGS
jgi:hypothetical protein